MQIRRPELITATLTALAFGWGGIAAPIVRGEITSVINGVGELSVPNTKTDVVQLTNLVGQAKSLITSGDYAGAREVLEVLKTHPEVLDVDVMMAELLISLGRAAEGQQWLERVSASGAAGSQPRLGIYLAFCELAVRQKRWFDGGVLTRTAQRIAPPDHWSDEMKLRVTTRIKLLGAQCCEGRTEWTSARSEYESLLKSGRAISEPVLRDANLGLARACFQLADYDAALRSIKIVASTDSTIGAHPPMDGPALRTKWDAE